MAGLVSLWRAPDERVASTAVSAGLAFDPNEDARRNWTALVLRELCRERQGKGDLIVTAVPQGFGSRLVEHVNESARKAIEDARSSS